MENNDNEMRSIHDNVEEPAQAPEPVQAPEQVQASEPVAETAVEAAVEAPVVEAVVEAPAVEEPEQALGFTATGAIGSMAADGPKRDNKVQGLGDKVAIYSTKNVRWEEAGGAVYKGVNIVKKDQADKWLTRSHVRTATPEEVKKALG
jgi:hypothetical protein